MARIVPLGYYHVKREIWVILGSQQAVLSEGRLSHCLESTQSEILSESSLLAASIVNKMVKNNHLTLVRLL